MQVPRHSVAQLCLGLRMDFQELRPRRLQFMEVLISTVLFMHLPRPSVAQLRSKLGVTTLMSLLRPSGLHMEFLGNCLCRLQLLVLCGHFPEYLEALDIYGRVAIRGASITELTILIPAEGPDGAVLLPHHGMAAAGSHLDNLFEALDL